MKIICSSLLTLALAGTFAGGLPQDARAQACDTLFEVISTIKQPTYGFPTIWDADYGSADQMVQFAGGILMDEGTVMSYAGKIDEKTSKPLETGLVELNRRGRTMTEKFYPAKNGEQPAGLVKIDNRFVGVSNFRVGKNNDKHVRLSWYDRDGTYKREQTFYDAAYDYEAQKIIPAVDGKGFVIVVHAVSRKDSTDQYGVIARFSADGKQTWKRAYRPGVNNKLIGLSQTDDNAYLATGKIIMDDGRMAGWIMKVAYDGTILWQRTYPRGKYSVFTAGAVSSKKSPDGTSFLLVTGAAEPADNGPHAAWVMEVDPLGEPLWQRYMRRKDYSFEGMDIAAQKDNRIVVTINATADRKDKEAHDHVRIITLSPRGIMLDDEAYLMGLEAKAVEVTQNANSDIVLVTTILKEQKKPEEEFGPPKPLPEGKQPDVPPPLQEGWVAVIPAPDLYTDPCLKIRN